MRAAQYGTEAERARWRVGYRSPAELGVAWADWQRRCKDCLWVSRQEQGAAAGPRHRCTRIGHAVAARGRCSYWARRVE